MLGHRQAALDTINNFESRLPSRLPSWFKQAWGLHKADVLYYVGQHDEAIATANAAIGQPVPTVHDWGFAGAFARWVAVACKGSDRESVGRATLDHLMGDLEKFDALDQVEALCAFLLLGCASDSESQDLESSIQGRLGSMPVALREQLIQLGVFPGAILVPA